MGAGSDQSGQASSLCSKAPPSGSNRAKMNANGPLNMSDPLIRALDHYVVLDPIEGEQILTAAETLVWLELQLSRLEQLPEDLAALPKGTAQAERLLDTACALELEPGFTVQWFAVRLEA